MPFSASLQERGSERLYFAFGSNLHFDQMSRRCPDSRYIGTAQLHNYRFQINSRGYANVLPSPGDCVEGLVYLLSADDESSLDQYEGVSTKVYEKDFLPVDIYTASINHVGRLVSDLVQQLRVENVSSTLNQRPSVGGQITKALVYVSLLFQSEGPIRDEYIGRMNAGIIDARKLGMSDLYIESCLRSYIPEQTLPKGELSSARK